MTLSKTEVSNNELKTTLGLAVSVIATEHFMSAGLSSPWSVAKFAVSDADKREVTHYFNEAATASLLFGGLISYKLHSIWPAISSALTVLYYKKLYSDALARTPTQNPTPVLSPLLPRLTEYNTEDSWKPLTNEEKHRIESFSMNSNQHQPSQQQNITSYINIDYS